METITIRTPEQVELTYELAGAGSRFFALAIDMAIRTLALILVYKALALVIRSVNLMPLHGALSSPAVFSLFVLGTLGGFITLGYSMFFETLWNGQTPGKRAAGLRVIKENGTPITVFDAALRNFMRAVDILPLFYGIGCLTMLISRKRKRLGDYVAGTLVVKIPAEGSPVLLPEIEVEAPADAPDISPLDERHFHLARNFIIRRGGLSSTIRGSLAREVCGALLSTIGLESHSFPSDEEFLEWVVISYGKAQASAKLGSKRL
ncbi:MAG: RDD family protein [Candidatus Eremiobacteraeota bacterium]|nr:RDD family protein [Candidatus Eremiobacteraeota bacterium]